MEVGLDPAILSLAAAVEVAFIWAPFVNVEVGLASRARAVRFRVGTISAVGVAGSGLPSGFDTRLAEVGVSVGEESENVSIAREAVVGSFKAARAKPRTARMGNEAIGSLNWRSS